jgi:hypothetical protein
MISIPANFHFVEPAEPFTNGMMETRGGNKYKFLGAINEGLLYSKSWGTNNPKYYLGSFEDANRPQWNEQTEILLEKMRILQKYEQMLVENNGDNKGKPTDIIEEERKRRRQEIEKKEKSLDSILKKISDNHQKVKHLSQFNDIYTLQENKEYRSEIHYLREWYYEQLD